jgi:hypothetical protein
MMAVLEADYTLTFHFNSYPNVWMHVFKAAHIADQRNGKSQISDFAYLSNHMEER